MIEDSQEQKRIEMQNCIRDRNEQVEELKNTPIYAQAQRQAERYMRKNRREYKRLRNHAEEALFAGNKSQYVYAIKKLRTMLKQPYTEEMIDQLWNTSINSLRDLYREASQKYARA